MNALKLHVGCGRTMLEGFVNIDQLPGCDVSLDLNVDRLPFDDNSVSCIFAYHALEHVENYLFAMGEMWRVLRHGGTLLAGTPYVTLTEYNLVNPFHVRHFNEFSFDFFDPEKLSGSANEDSGIVFKKRWHRFHYMPGFDLVPDPFITMMRRHLFNVVRAIDFGVVAIKEPGVPIDSKDGLAFEAEFDRILKARLRAAWA